MRVLNAFTDFPYRAGAVALISAVAGLTACGGGGGGGGGAVPPAPVVPAVTVVSTVDPQATGLGAIARIISGSLDAINAGDDVAYMTTTAGAQIGALINALAGSDFSLPPNMPAALAGGALNPLAIALGNFDNVVGGTIDLYLSHNTTGADASVSVYGNAAANDGDLSTLILVPAAPVNLGSDNPVDIAAADFDNDGLDDVITANDAGSDLTIALNNGAGNFALPAFSQVIGGALGPVALVTGDFDGTGVGQSDIAVVNGTNLQVLLNSGVFGAPTATAIATSPETIAVGDFDGINGPDLVVGSTVADEIRVFLNNGLGGFAITLQGAIPVVGTAPFTIIDIEIGNFDGTGNLDIALLLDSDEIVFLLNDQGGAGLFAPSSNSPISLVGTGAVDMAVFDFDLGAGFDDLAVAETGAGGQIEVLQTS